jgi:hypothetical protein
MDQMAQERQAELLRETDGYRGGGLTLRMRVSARITRFHTGTRWSRAGVVGPSTPDPVKINLLKASPRSGKKATTARRFSGRTSC